MGHEAGVSGHGSRWLVVDLRGLGERPGCALRVLLAGDVLRRQQNATGAASTWLSVVGDDHRVLSHWCGVAGRLGIGDPSGCVTFAVRSAAAAEYDVGSPLVAIAPAERRPEIAPIPAARTLHVGGLKLPNIGLGGDPIGSVLEGRDPLAVRLALLRFPLASHAVLSTARLRRAEESLHRWRVKVSGWADMPAAPAPSERIVEMRHALAADLDTAAVLTSLHRIELDLHLTSGSKFATFSQADRVLALDLGQLVGRLRR